MTPSQAALCALCQQRTEPTPGCPACKDLRDTHALLAAPHAALDLAPPSTLKVLNTTPGALVFETRREPAIGFVIIFLGVFVVTIMTIVWNASGTETLPFVIPLDLISFAAIGFGVRFLRYRQTISLERGTLTVSERPSSKAPITARDIEQLTVQAHHATYWHKGLRWGARYDLHARTGSGTVLLLSGGHAEVRFLEAKLEGALGIRDAPERNTVTVVGS